MRIISFRQYFSLFRVSQFSREILIKRFNHGSEVTNRTNVAIFGGGIMGVSTAYFLKDNAPLDFNVTIFERDPYYTRASTTLSVGGIRQQFSLTENIQMSMYSAGFLQSVQKHLNVLDFENPLDISLHLKGYLTLADDQQSKLLLENYEMQKQHGASIDLLSPKEIRKRFPMINTNDISMAVYGTDNEGWFDPYQLLMAMRQKAMFLGAKFIHANVVGFPYINEKSCNKVLIKRPNGNLEVVEFDIGVICTGYDSKNLATALGYGSRKIRDFRQEVNFPIEPRKRYVFVFNCRHQDLGEWDFPFLIDKSGVYCRREKGTDFLCGRSPKTMEEEPDTDSLDVDYLYFDQFIYPILAHRIPVFASGVKMKSAWAGFYDFNRLDQNPIIGKDPIYSNIYWACGFSGHGIQMAPAVGRAMMELILCQKFETIDLKRLGWQRIIQNQPLKELNIY